MSKVCVHKLKLNFGTRKKIRELYELSKALPKHKKERERFSSGT